MTLLRGAVALAARQAEFSGVLETLCGPHLSILKVKKVEDET